VRRGRRGRRRQKIEDRRLKMIEESNTLIPQLMNIQSIRGGRERREGEGRREREKYTICVNNKIS
jgi:hypothetical protein